MEHAGGDLGPGDRPHSLGEPDQKGNGGLETAGQVEPDVLVLAVPRPLEEPAAEQSQIGHGGPEVVAVARVQPGHPRDHRIAAQPVEGAGQFGQVAYPPAVAAGQRQRVEERGGEPRAVSDVISSAVLPLVSRAFSPAALSNVSSSALTADGHRAGASRAHSPPARRSRPPPATARASPTPVRTRPRSPWREGVRGVGDLVGVRVVQFAVVRVFQEVQDAPADGDQVDGHLTPVPPWHSRSPRRSWPRAQFVERFAAQPRCRRHVLGRSGQVDGEVAAGHGQEHARYRVVMFGGRRDVRGLGVDGGAVVGLGVRGQDVDGHGHRGATGMASRKRTEPRRMISGASRPGRSEPKIRSNDS